MGLLARIDTKTASRPLSYAAGAEDAATNEREVAAAPVTTQTRPRPGGMRIWGAKEQRRGADGRRSGQKRQTRSALAEVHFPPPRTCTRCARSHRGAASY